MWKGFPKVPVEPARSPQDEDHEAGIEAAARAMIQYDDDWDEAADGDKDVFRRMARDGVAAYLARVSPSRDGTVAVEDAEQALLQIRDYATNRHIGAGRALKLIDEAVGRWLAECSPASTGDREDARP